MAYNKTFIVLNKNDSGFCENGATGYCKIEVKDEACSISVFVQGLKKVDKVMYRIYLLHSEKDNIMPVHIADIDLLKGSGELNVETSAKNVVFSQIEISKINIVIVCAVSKDMNSIEFPLVGYHNLTKNDLWRNSFISYFRQNSNKEQEKNTQPSEKDSQKFEKSEKEIYEKVKPFKKENFQTVIDFVKDIKKGSIKKLDDVMNNISETEECNPFANAKLKYKWWKVKDMKFFDNIFKYSIISTQIFKHPIIKKMLRESNHCLFGAVSDVDEKIRYVAYGFPSKYSLKDQVYVGGFANFYPCIGYAKVNGSYGYWVVHIKLEDNSIVMTL